MLPMRPELLKGHLDALLLAVLEPGPQHGYAVIEALRVGSNGALDLPTGTVYPAGAAVGPTISPPPGRQPSASNAPSGTSSPPPSPPCSRGDHGRPPSS